MFYTSLSRVLWSSIYHGRVWRGSPFLILFALGNPSPVMHYSPHDAERHINQCGGMHTLVKTKVTKEDGTSTEELPSSAACLRLCGINIGVEGPAHCGWYCPRAGGPGLTKQAEQARGSMPVSSIPECLCFSSCLSFPSWWTVTCKLT